jgi:hypothetical protein
MVKVPVRFVVMKVLRVATDAFAAVGLRVGLANKIPILG